MKKIAVLCICALTLGLTACGSNTTPKTEDTTANTQEVATETTEPTTETTKVEETTEEETTEYATLADGIYNSSLIEEPSEYDLGYVKRVEFVEGGLVIEASFYRFENEDWDNPVTFDMDTYFIPLADSTVYQYSGGDEGPTPFAAEEFQQELQNCMGSGLGFYVEIENGVAKLVEFYS